MSAPAMTAAQAADMDAEFDGAIARHRADIVDKLVMTGTGPNYVAHPSRDCFVLLRGGSVEVLPRALAPLLFMPLAAEGGCIAACLAEPPPDGTVWIVHFGATGVTHAWRTTRGLVWPDGGRADG